MSNRCPVMVTPGRRCAKLAGPSGTCDKHRVMVAERVGALVFQLARLARRWRLAAIVVSGLLLASVVGHVVR